MQILTNNRPRINWLLILQGWAMLWVVIGHSPLTKAGGGPAWEYALFQIAYSFHMPLFMFISGYLFHHTRFDKVDGRLKFEDYKSMVCNKLKRLMIPFVFFTFVAFLLKMAFPGEMARQASINAKEILNAFLYPFDNPLREMWFVATLMWFFLLMPLWTLVIRRQWTKWLTLALLTVLHFYYPNISMLCIDKLCQHAVWFYSGIIISEEGYIAKITGNHKWSVLIIGLVIYVAGLFTDGFFNIIGGIAFSISLALILDQYLPCIFSSFRNYTYQIFLIGIFAQMFVKMMFRHVMMPYILAYTLCLLSGLYVPVIVSKILQKINWAPLLYCIGLTPKKNQ